MSLHPSYKAYSHEIATDIQSSIYWESAKVEPLGVFTKKSEGARFSKAVDKIYGTKFGLTEVRPIVQFFYRIYSPSLNYLQACVLTGYYDKRLAPLGIEIGAIANGKTPSRIFMLRNDRSKEPNPIMELILADKILIDQFMKIGEMFKLPQRAFDESFPCNSYVNPYFEASSIDSKSIITIGSAIKPIKQVKVAAEDRKKYKYISFRIQLPVFQVISRVRKYIEYFAWDGPAETFSAVAPLSFFMARSVQAESQE